MSGIAEAAIEGVFNLAQSGINAAVQKKQAKRQYEYDVKKMQLQHQQNIDLWNMQNEYNTPKAQMERYSDAGLNPNLIYSEGASALSGNSTSPPPSAEIASYQVPNNEIKIFDGVVDSYVKAKQLALTEQSQEKQLEYQDAQIDEIRDRIVTADVQRSLLLVDRLRKELDLNQSTYEFNEKKSNRSFRDNLHKHNNDMLELNYKQALENLSKTQVENKISNYQLSHNLPLQTEQFKLANEAQSIRNEFLLYNTDNLREEMSRNEWRFEQELIKSGYSEEKAKLELEKFKKDIDKVDKEINLLSQQYSLNRWEAVRKWLELGQKTYNDEFKNKIRLLEIFGSLL